MKFYVRYDQVDVPAKPWKIKEMQDTGFLGGGTATKFVVSDVSGKDGSITVDVISEETLDGGRAGYAFTVSKEGILQSVMKLEINKNGERKTTAIDSKVFCSGNSPLACPDFIRMKKLEEEAAKVSVRLVTIEVDNTYGNETWERGLPWWKQRFNVDEKGLVEEKAYLTACHYAGKDMTFQVPANVRELPEGFHPEPLPTGKGTPKPAGTVENP